MTRAARYWLVFALVGLLASPSSAEEFLGIEGQVDEQASAPKDEGAQEEAEPAPSPSAEVSSDPYAGSFTFGFHIGAGLGLFRARALVGYGMSKWMGVDTSVDYARHESKDGIGTVYGPDTALVVRLPNPTVLTPFAGAGPGYRRWKREHQGEVFSDGGSVTANAFVGLHIRLTEHFGIVGQRQQVTYLGDPPVSFSDHESEEPRSSITNSVDFYARF